MRQEYERKSKDVQYKFEVRMKEVRDVMTQRRKNEIKAIEKMKDTHINELTKQHKQVSFQNQKKKKKKKKTDFW